MIRPATTRVILGFDSSNSLREVSFVKSTAVTDTDVSIERVNLALYDSYVVIGPTLALGGVWVTECVNTAIEAAIDLGTSAPHPLAKIGKDVASTAALVSAIVFGVIVLLILLPRVLDRLAG